MRFLLMMVCVSALMSKAHAQWTDQFQAVDSENAKGNTVTTIAASGEVLVAGVFNQEFSFGAYDLEPIARSTYLIKYTSDGAKQWGISIAGAATPTAMTTDDAGNVYIAGIYADVVVFGSTDGATQSVTGIEDVWGDIVTEQGAGFIAKYNSSGVLLKVQAYKPEPFEEALSPDVIYYDQNLQFRILKIEFISGKLYASVTYTGKNESNGFSLNASHSMASGWAFVDQFNGSIIRFDTNTLLIEHIYATLSPENEQTGTVWVQNALFSISENQLYVGFFTRGGIQNLTVQEHQEAFSFPIGDDEGSGHVFLKLNLSTGSLLAKNASFFTERRDPEYELRSLDYVDGMLLLSGTHMEPLIFKPEVMPQAIDVFVVALDADNMGTVKFAVNSGATVQRDYAASTLFSNHLLVACNEASTSGVFTVNLPDGTTTVYTPQDDNVLTNSIHSKDGVMLTVQNVLGATSADLATTRVSVEGASTDIQHPGIGKDAIISFNSAESALYFTQPATVSVYNAVGGLVLQSVNAESLSVSSLPKGVYIALAKTNGESGKLKFVRK